MAHPPSVGWPRSGAGKKANACGKKKEVCVRWLSLHPTHRFIDAVVPQGGPEVVDGQLVGVQGDCSHFVDESAKEKRVK